MKEIEFLFTRGANCPKDMTAWYIGSAALNQFSK